MVTCLEILPEYVPCNPEGLTSDGHSIALCGKRNGGGKRNGTRSTAATPQRKYFGRGSEKIV